MVEDKRSKLYLQLHKAIVTNYSKTKPEIYLFIAAQHPYYLCLFLHMSIFREVSQ
jgi:hypothetical protein